MAVSIRCSPVGWNLRIREREATHVVYRSTAAGSLGEWPWRNGAYGEGGISFDTTYVIQWAGMIGYTS